MISTQRAVLIILLVAACTFLTRVLPFLFFGGQKSVPKAVNYLGKILPPAIMAILVVYCLKGISFAQAPYGAAELLSAALVVVLHLWKRNNLLSIGLGTACYMILIQVVFA